jgi:hypothetical protein
MRKSILFTICLLFVFVSSAHAGFKWGVDTYENVDDSLIINSLGDQVTPSTFGKLGVNDFIEENGVKNYLALEGYSQANDYNPSITNSQFASYYNTKPGDGYTKLTFAGLQGDPRATQDVYVLTSEYNRLSAQEQANSIDSLNAGQLVQNTNIANNASRIEVVNNNSVSRDNVLQSNINAEGTARANADNVLQNNIDNESNARVKADKKETKARIAGDKKLQRNINREANIRETADTSLQNNINDVDARQTTWNQNQDATLANHDQRINENTNRINDLDKRVGKLENTQSVIGAEVRVYDGKKWTVTTFVDYTATRNTIDRAGVRFTYKVGKSYEEKRIDELEAKIKALHSFEQGEAEVPANERTDGEFYTQGSAVGYHQKF